MNRQQRRQKQQRHDERDIQRAADERDKLRREGIDFAVDAIMVLALYTMNTHFGFGAVRLGRFAQEFEALTYKVASRKVSVSALAADIEDKTGIEYNERKNEWFFPTRERKK